jgi:hypothetical protein
MTMLSPAGIPTGSFSTSASRSGAEGSLLSEFDWPRKRASQPALSRNLAFLPEVENPTGREYYFSFSRTQRVAVSHERDSLHWRVNFGKPEIIQHLGQSG